MIAGALEQAGVAPRAISYIEAHGTGTSLGRSDRGDRAGQGLRRGRSRPTCAIGSVKSNIGHCESAAGIAGLTKVLLQMKHRTLAPSLHAEELNPNIDFARTPFVVQREAAPWEAMPRIAGLSSFGAGGANAHVIVSDYEPAARAVTAAGPVVLVLSAKTEESLRRRADLLLGVLAGESPPALAEIAYTLQVGREAMAKRLGLVAASADEARSKLEAFLRGEIVDAVYRGDVKRGATPPDVASGLSSARIAELWTRGGAVAWETLYGEVPPRRVSLPTYPFARERYWPSESPSGAAPALRPAVPAGEDRQVFRRLVRDLQAGALSVDAARDIVLRRRSSSSSSSS